MLSKSQGVIKLDFDDKAHPDMDVIDKKLRRAGYERRYTQVRKSPGGNGWHVLLDVEPRPRTAMEVVAIQAVLGSDPWREAMQLARAKAFPKCPKFMRDAWNVLYEPDPRRARRINARKALLGRVDARKRRKGVL